MQTDLILQRPRTSDNTELLLLFHGVGSSAEDLAPLGQALASQLGHGIDARVVQAIGRGLKALSEENGS